MDSTQNHLNFLLGLLETCAVRTKFRINFFEISFFHIFQGTGIELLGLLGYSTASKRLTLGVTVILEVWNFDYPEKNLIFQCAFRSVYENSRNVNQVF